jgi:RND family efflux transporter MFP subunit
MSVQPEFANSKLKLMGGVGLCLVLFLIWIEGGFVPKVSPGEEAEKRDTLNVATMTVSRQSAEGPIAWPARVEPLKTIQIASKFPGRIMEIAVSAGSKVSRGQQLVRLDNTELNARLSQAKAHLGAAEAGFSRASADAHRIRNLFEKEAATRQTLDSAIAEERQTKASVQEAKALVSQMESEVAETNLVAPYDGMVEHRLQEPGDLVLPGQPIVTFLQSPVLRIEASIPSSCANSILVGGKITATLPDQSTEVSAIVEEKEPASDRETQTQRIKARLAGDAQVLPGSFVWLQQACGSESLMLIPATAIKRVGQLETVWITKEGHSRIRHIRTGRRLGDNIEVLSGLNEGDQLVIGAP